MDLQPLFFPIRRPRDAALKMAAKSTVDINHIPYYRATRSRRTDSRPISSSPRRIVALFLFPFSKPRVSARVSPRVAVSTCSCLCRYPLSTLVRIHEARMRIAKLEHCFYVVGTRDRDGVRDFAIEPNHRCVQLRLELQWL